MGINRIGATERMSSVVVHNGVAYLSGVVGRSGTDTASQTAAALQEIDRILAEAGTDKSHVLSATVWLADIADIGEMNQVWDGWIDPDNPPARATGQVPLAREKYRVEVTVVAAVPRPSDA